MMAKRNLCAESVALPDGQVLICGLNLDHPGPVHKHGEVRWPAPDAPDEAFAQ